MKRYVFTDIRIIWMDVYVFGCPQTNLNETDCILYGNVLNPL